MKGGYQIIDCKGLDLTTEGGVTIPEVYKKVATGKALLLENVVISGVEIGGMFAFSTPAEDSAVIPLSLVIPDTGVIDVAITVTNENNVSATIIEPADDGE